MGSSANLSRRFNEHISGHHSNLHLQNAFKKYGLENFCFIILEWFTNDPTLTTIANAKLLVAMEKNKFFIIGS